MKPLDLLLIAIILLGFSPCAIELGRFTTPLNSKVVQGKITSIHADSFGGRRRSFSTVTVSYEYKADDGILRTGSATSFPSWSGQCRLNAPFTEGSTVLVEYNPSTPDSSVCSGIGWAFAGEHLFDGFIVAVIAVISLTLKGMMGSKESAAHETVKANRRDSRFSS